MNYHYVQFALCGGKLRVINSSHLLYQLTSIRKCADIVICATSQMSSHFSFDPPTIHPTPGYKVTKTSLMFISLHMCVGVDGCECVCVFDVFWYMLTVIIAV